MTSFFDSHCHIDEPEFDGDRSEMLERSRLVGVDHWIIIGAVGDIASAHRSVALAKSTPGAWATVATHPHDVEKMTEAWWQTHEALSREPSVVAIGETGLDYYYDHSPRELQKQAFIRFIALANACGKPVVCHIRDAHADAQAILEAHPPTRGAIIHCFTGTPEEARWYAERGFYVSFSGIVTYKSATPIREALKLVPLPQILIETDCPYLAPIPMRGRRNEPAFLAHTAATVANTLGMSTEEIANITFGNTKRAFGISP